MKTEAILNATYHYSDIPPSITHAIKSLFGVKELSQLSSEKTRSLQNACREFFVEVKKTDYHDVSGAYTLKYFPANFFKIWTPLRDLLSKGQIQTNCSILELGCGPGSSTMGMMEFYRILASDNPSVPFRLKFVLLEREKTFFDIFKVVYEQYKLTFPHNLMIEINLLHKDIGSFFELPTQDKFDYIIESNVLNPNEKIKDSSLDHLCDAFAGILNPHASVIMIEPAKRGLREYLYKIKNLLVKSGLSVFSPCMCENEFCRALPMARVDLRGISLIQDLRAVGIFNEKDYHYFEYAVMRNDSLVMHKRPQNAFLLCDLSSLIGQTIRFEAYILFAFEDENGFDLKICDGSKLSKDVSLHVPKSILADEALDLLSIGRGGYVKVKKAKITSETRIECGLSTMVEIM